MRFRNKQSLSLNIFKNLIYHNMIIKNFYAQLHKYIQQILTKLQGETDKFKNKNKPILFYLSV